MKIDYIDLFSGIGGFALGLRQAGFQFKNHYFAEIDKNAIDIYTKHFPNAKELGDVRTIRDFSKLKADIITFGFPCQDLSVAGKRKGLAGNRSGLFFEAMRIIRELRPKYFIFENVKGLLTNNRGTDFVRCLREIADIGIYECEWQLVNTSWVLPQNRERVYFIGCLREFSGAKILPIGEGNKDTSTIQGQIAKCLTTKGTHTNGSYIAEHQQFQKINTVGFYAPSKHNAARVVSSYGLAPTVMENHGTITAVIQAPQTENTAQTSVLLIPEATKKGFIEIPAHCGVDLTQLSSQTRRGRLMKENCNTITTQCNGLSWFDGDRVRKLTPLECERLQGFPDGWTKYGADRKKMSDTARYKALGNAVTVDFPRIIGSRIIERIKL